MKGTADVSGKGSSAMTTITYYAALPFAHANDGTNRAGRGGLQPAREARTYQFCGARRCLQWRQGAATDSTYSYEPSGSGLGKPPRMRIPGSSVAMGKCSDPI